MSVRHNINIVAGEPISRVITYKDPDAVAINLTGYTPTRHYQRVNQ